MQQSRLTIDIPFPFKMEENIIDKTHYTNFIEKMYQLMKFLSI